MAHATITLDDDLLREVERAAAERNVTVDEFVCAVLREKLPGPRPWPRPKPRSLGIISTSETDLARRSGDMRLAPKSLGADASSHTDTAEAAGDWQYEPRSWR